MQGSFVSIKSRNTRLVLLFPILLVLTVVLVAALPPTSSATQGNAQGDNTQKPARAQFVPGQVLVRYRSEPLAKQKTFEKLISFDGRQLSIQLERFDGADIVPGLRLAHVAPEDTMAAIAALKARPDVLYAEPNYLLHLDANPNDPRFLSNELYGLAKVGAPQAWDTIKGSSDTVQAGFGSPRIVVGVIDEGIDILHQDLAANIWTNPGEGSTPDGLDNDANGFVDDLHGYDFALNSGVITPQTHGTHVAGTIGAVGNNATGVVGVNWSVGLMSLKFIDGFQADTADAIRACNYAKMMRDRWVNSGGTQGANLRVLNNSYGDNEFSQSFLDSINELNQSGILFVASAGNVDGFSTQPDNDLVAHYPSGYAAPNVIGVASTGQTDNLAADSHYGAATVHLGAPGVGILSTTPSNTYSFSSGTSMATPHVAGAAALLLAQNPNLTIQRLKGLLLYNGDLVPSLAGKTVTGRRLNVANSVAAAAENDVTVPGTVSNLHLNSQTGRSLNVGWAASGDDGATGQAALYTISFTDASSGAVIFLKNIIPAAPGVMQAVDVKLPYRHPTGTLNLREYDNAGNEGVPATLPISISLIVSDPYLTSLSSHVSLSTGGTGLATNCDDCFKTQALPFSFPYFGENFNSVNVTSNGAMYFATPPANDAVSSAVGLSHFKMVAGLWDDLRTDRVAGDDIYVVTPDANRIIFRWQAVTFGNGTPATELPVSFEIELRSDGTILTRYGNAPQSPDADVISRVVGISGGEPDTYIVPSHTSEGTVIDLTNAQTVTFLPRSLTTNPLDDPNAQFFVRQHYLDFLNREPDPGGLAFWSDQITSCGSDQTCVEIRRINVSAAFFLSIEFQETGYLVERMYKVAYGDALGTSTFPGPGSHQLAVPIIRRSEFVPDSLQISNGVIIGQPGADALLEANKVTFANDFVTRTRFTAAYATSLTPTQFVDALIAKAGFTPTPEQRQAFIDEFGVAGNTTDTAARARTVRAIAENGTFSQLERNRAFVLMQYFGYLRRDPDTSPDTDYTGYDFWLGKLNQFDGNFVNAEMVKAFIISGEYRQRFGP